MSNMDVDQNNCQNTLLLKRLLWPGLMLIAIAITLWGETQGKIILFFNIAYLFLVISLFFLEKWLPYEQEWLKPDGQNIASLLHTLTSKGTVQVLFAVSATIGLAEYVVPLAQYQQSENVSGFWPTEWPLVVQIIIGLIVAEFGLYWAHRLSHEVEVLWRFHAIHHSVTKLWFFNTGRFHFIDSLVSIVAVLGLTLLAGAPMEVLQWGAILTAFFGILTHCNVDMRCGWFNYIFNTPQLHRWHHSKQLHEGNRNYGENITLWDHAFGTWFNGDYRPSQDIGIKELSPKSFLTQLAWPFLSISMRKRILVDYVAVPFETEKQMKKRLKRLRDGAE
jgi:sterol desaturase/sphingolipid hydroxylase (fatty acid hydroxylase superfamily)